MSKAVLVVDDSIMVRKQVSSALTAAGFEVIEAIDGLDAMSKLGGEHAVGLVITDVNMPRMDGLQLLESVQSLPVRPSVLILTTDGQPAMVARARALGAIGWMSKPFKADHVLAVARKTLGVGGAAHASLGS